MFLFFVCFKKYTEKLFHFFVCQKNTPKKCSFFSYNTPKNVPIFLHVHVFRDVFLCFSFFRFCFQFFLFSLFFSFDFVYMFFLVIFRFFLIFLIYFRCFPVFLDIYHIYIFYFLRFLLCFHFFFVSLLFLIFLLWVSKDSLPSSSFLSFMLKNTPRVVPFACLEMVPAFPLKFVSWTVRTVRRLLQTSFLPCTPLKNAPNEVSTFVLEKCSTSVFKSNFKFDLFFVLKIQTMYRFYR